MDALAAPRSRKRTLMLLVISGLLAAAAAVVGIDDHLPGILAAYLAATAFVLGFVPPGAAYGSSCPCCWQRCSAWCCSSS